MRDGVIIDCGRQEGGSYKKEDDDWWLDLYVMLSRATKLEDLLLLRAPDLDFFANGPPKTLRRQLAKFRDVQRIAERERSRLQGNSVSLHYFVKSEI